MTVGTRIIAGFCVALLGVLVIGVVSYRSTKKMIETADWVTHTHEVIAKLDSVLATLMDDESGQRGYVITGDESYLQVYNTSRASLDKTVQDVRKLTSDNPRQQKRLDVLEPLIASKLSVLQEIVDLRKDKEKGFDNAVAAVQKGQGKELMDNVRKTIADMEDEETSLLKVRNEEAAASATGATYAIVFGTLAAFVICIFVGVLIVRGINSSLNATINALTTAATEIVASTSQLAASATETSVSVTETTTTMEEVRQTAQEASKRAKYVSDSAQKAASISQNGKKSADETAAGIGDIQRQMEEIATSTVRLGSKSREVGQIIAAVDDLSQQSNLLAVNAAIEAAKAGEQGKGFSVVAQEVKSLSMQSKDATSKIRDILNDIQDAIGKAVMATEQGTKAVEAGVKQSAVAGESIVALTSSVSESAMAATQIAASSQQQVVGIEQVSRAMESIKQASGQNVESAKQLESAARNLNAMGHQLKELVGKYKS